MLVLAALIHPNCWRAGAARTPEHCGGRQQEWIIIVDIIFNIYALLRNIISPDDMTTLASGVNNCKLTQPVEWRDKYCKYTS